MVAHDETHEVSECIFSPPVKWNGVKAQVFPVKQTRYHRTTHLTVARTLTIE